ncbi:MAG: exonuclease subunit SbcD [Acidimicrobiales bacterium]
MKLLHTADWHLGKAVRGRSRADEHRAVLAEIAGVADQHDVDVVLVVGDVFDTAAPSPESEQIAYQALLDLSHHGERPVVVVTGNHDNPRRLGAVSPVLDLTNVHVASGFRPPADGGVLRLDVGGVPLEVALVPFLSQRYVVHAADLLELDAAEAGGRYNARVGQLLAALTAGFADTPDAVHVVAAHLHVDGGVLGGGERSAHTIFDYAVSPVAFPATAHYVALGHLHRTQQVAGPCPIWYPGSPLTMDFGEEADTKAVLVVDADPGRPARVETVALASGRRFRTVAGTVAELAALAEAGLVDDDDLLRVVVREPVRVGIGDEVRELFPGAVDVRLEPPEAEPADRSGRGDDGPTRLGRSPRELFGEYLADEGVDDERLVALFDELLDAATAGGVAEPEATGAPRGRRRRAKVDDGGADDETAADVVPADEAAADDGLADALAASLAAVEARTTAGADDGQADDGPADDGPADDDGDADAS